MTAKKPNTSVGNGLNRPLAAEWSAAFRLLPLRLPVRPLKGPEGRAPSARFLLRRKEKRACIFPEALKATYRTIGDLAQTAALLVWPLLLTLGASSCSSPRFEKSKLTRYEYQQPQMGMPFRIVLYALDRTTADTAAAAAFRRVQQLNSILSDYDPDSELSALSRSSGRGQIVKVSDDLWKVLERAQRLSEQSKGAFDITIGPCVNLWRQARREEKMPDERRLAEARQAVGYRNLRLDARKRTAELLVPNMRLDLGGIAKGYAIDGAMAVLRKHGIRRALVAGSGDMVMSDPPPGKKGWRIQMDPLDATNAPPTRFVLLSNAAMAASGDTFQHLAIGGKRYSHIVDPRTGIGLTDHSLVFIIAKNCFTADSLDTAVSALGPVAGLKLIGATPGAAARIIRKPDDKIEVFESKRFPKYYEPIRSN